MTFLKLNNKNKLVAVIPAFNEESTISKIILLTKQYVDHIIVYDDGSSDTTSKIVSNLDVTLLNSKENKGKGNALRLLFKEAIKLNPDIIITIDADGQHDPSQIPKLIKPIIFDKADLVIGSRFISGSETDIPFHRYFGSRLINILQNVFFKSGVTDTQSGFRAFSYKSFNNILVTKETGYGIETESLVFALKRGTRIIEIPVSIKYKGLQYTSKKNFLIHGIEIILTLLKLIARNSFSSFGYEEKYSEDVF